MWNEGLGAAALVLAAAVLGGCGGEEGSFTRGAGGGSTPGAGGGGALPAGGGEGGAGGAAAARATAENNPACQAIRPFYWEIGDASGALPGASGSLGEGVTDATAMDVASATKLVWGAYVVERFKDDVAGIDEGAMTMRSGYASLKYVSCLGATTVDDCLNTNENGALDPGKVGIFNYGGGHFQKHASDLGLGDRTSETLAEELLGVLGADLEVSFSSPQLASGMRVTPAAYARFLRKVVSGELAIGAHLGELGVDTWCPDPAAASCYSPVSSPLPGSAEPPPVAEAWHYSYGHWIEDDAGAGVHNDGAFSSPGAFGFYPWIDASRAYYGLVGRQEKLDPQAYLTSVECGRRVRRAFLTGVEVTL